MFKHTKPADILAMNSEELDAHNKAVTKKIMIQTSLMIIVSVGVQVGAAALSNHLAKKYDEQNDEN